MRRTIRPDFSIADYEKERIANAEPKEIFRELQEEGAYLAIHRPTYFRYLLLRNASIYNGMGHEKFYELKREVDKSCTD